MISISSRRTSSEVSLFIYGTKSTKQTPKLPKYIYQNYDIYEITGEKPEN